MRIFLEKTELSARHTFVQSPPGKWLGVSTIKVYKEHDCAGVTATPWPLCFCAPIFQEVTSMKLGIRCWPDRFAFVVLGGPAAGCPVLAPFAGRVAMLPKRSIELACRFCRPYGTRLHFLLPLTRRSSAALPPQPSSRGSSHTPTAGILS
jgi:hypothetical protein